MAEESRKAFPLYISECHSTSEDVVVEYSSIVKIIDEVNATFDQTFTTIEEIV